MQFAPRSQKFRNTCVRARTEKPGGRLPAREDLSEFYRQAGSDLFDL